MPDWATIANMSPTSWDDPSDTASIEIGADLWHQYGLSVSPADLYVAILSEPRLAQQQEGTQP
mgnify:CR=1 FL=1